MQKKEDLRNHIIFHCNTIHPSSFITYICIFTASTYLVFHIQKYMHRIAGTRSEILFSLSMLVVHLYLTEMIITPTFSAAITIILKLSLEVGAAYFIPPEFSRFYNTFPF